MFKAIKIPLSEWSDTISTSKIDNFPKCKVQYRLGNVLVHPNLTAEDMPLLQSKMAAARIKHPTIRVGVIDKHIIDNVTIPTLRDVV